MTDEDLQGRRALVTGGAGFIGSNLSKNLLESGYKVTVFDSLARRGSERNLQWLKQIDTDKKMTFIHSDVRDFAAVQDAVEGADEVFHLAAQVAVTTSVDSPRTDFEIPSVPISLETLSSNSLMSRAKENFNVSRLVIIIEVRESITTKG